MEIPDTFLLERFVRARPDEYGHVKAALQAMKNRERIKIIRMVDTRYSILLQNKESQWSSRPPDQAFFSSEIGDQRGAQQDRGRCCGGTQGRGRGGSSIKSGGSRSGRGSSSTSSVSGSSHGGGSRPPGHC